MPEVGLVVGNEEKLAEETWQSVATGDVSDKLLISDVMEVRDIAPHFVEVDDHTRAFLQIQQDVTIAAPCIIPYGGAIHAPSLLAPSFGRQNLVANGYQEIVLTGVDLTSYGKDLPGAPSRQSCQASAATCAGFAGFEYPPLILRKLMRICCWPLPRKTG